MNKKLLSLPLAGIISFQVATPVLALENNNHLKNNNHVVREFEEQSLSNVSSSDLSNFKEAFYDSLYEDGIVIQEPRGIKSKAAKIAAKQMMKKLYKIGSKSFDKAIKSAAKKLPSSVAYKVEKYITYSRVSAVLNIVANAEGTITDAISGQLQKFLPRWVADITSRTIVFILL